MAKERTMRISDELYDLLKNIKRKHARATGEFKTFNDIVYDELPSVDEYEVDEDEEEEEDEE